MSSEAGKYAENRIDALSSVARASQAGAGPSSRKHVFSAIVMGVFFAALLLALIAGIVVYKHVTDVQAQANAQREGIGLVANAVRANDASGAIAVGQGPEGRSLVVVEKLASGTYETRFYLYQGKVVQEYSLAGSMYTPERANTVTQSNSFDFTYSHGLLSVTTDQGTAEVALRSLQGGE